MPPEPELFHNRSLGDLLNIAESKFGEVVFEPTTIESITLDILHIKDMNAYIDKILQGAKSADIILPLWAKIWPCSLILSYYLNRLDGSGKKLLEIGAGVGLCGLVAASLNFDVVLSDINEDALLFAKINTLKNNLQDKISIQRIDFAKSRPESTFDIIVGTEILSDQDLYRPLLKFLLRRLVPSADSQVLFAHDYHRKGEKFFKMAQDDFNYSEKTIGFKSAEGAEDPEKRLCVLTRMIPKKVL